LRWKEDGSFIHPIIIMENTSEIPFHFNAADSGLLLNRTPTQMFFTSWAVHSGEVEPGVTKEVAFRDWYWWNERHLRKIGLSYVSSDSKSNGSTVCAEWDVSDVQ
jgi:hypothetical protein